NQPGQQSKGCSRVLNPHQHKATHGRIERLVVCNRRDIGVDELNIPEPSTRDASPCAGDRALVALDTHDLPRRTNQPSEQQSNAPDTRTDVQYSLTWTNACFTEKALGKRGNPFSLPDEALVLRVGTTQGIVRHEFARCIPVSVAWLPVCTVSVA